MNRWQDQAEVKIRDGNFLPCSYKHGVETYARRNAAGVRIIEHGPHRSLLVQRADGSLMALVPIRDGRPYAFGDAIARVLLDN